MMLLNTKCCGASISLLEMDGDVPLYSIADSNIDLEFMMDSEINRILGSRHGGGGALIPHKPVFGLFHAHDMYLFLGSLLIPFSTTVIIIYWNRVGVELNQIILMVDYILR
jgi:hypothetical protein